LSSITVSTVAFSLLSSAPEAMTSIDSATVADLKLKIDASRLLHLQLNVIARGGLEARRFHPHVIDARLQ
jgi:hypothetical protein